MHWIFSILLMLIIIFLLWFFVGGKEHDYVGLELFTPLPFNQIEDHFTVTMKPTTNKQLEPEICYSTAPQPIQPSPWKREEACCRAIEELTGKSFKRNSRPYFLKNPETKGVLQLDCFNEELGIAVEHNGEQHYHYPNRFHRSESEWLSQVRRDEFKIKMCDQKGIYLITVPYTVPYDQIKSEIFRQLQPILQHKTGQD